MAEHTVRGGAGFSESQVILALQKFPDLIHQCVNRSEEFLRCQYKPDLNRRLSTCGPASTRIANQLSRIQFKTEAEAPKIFPEGERIEFVIAPGANSKIYINRTLLYRSGGNDLEYPIGLDDATSLVTKIVAAESKCLQDKDIQIVSDDLSALAHTTSVTEELGAANDAVRIFDPARRIRIMHFGAESADNNLKWGSSYIQDSEGMTSIHAAILKSLPCEKSSAVRYALSRFEDKHLSLKGGRLLADVEAKVHFMCKNDRAVLNEEMIIIHTEFVPLIVKSPRNPDDRAYRFVPERTKISKKD